MDSKTRSRLSLGFLTVITLMIMLGTSPAYGFVISTCNVPALCTVGTPTEGWDGPGLGSVTIDYYVGNPFQTNNGLPTGISLADFDSAITSAMSIWSSVVQVGFNRVDDAINDPTGVNTFGANQITLYVAHEAAGVDHGDGNPFDGAWNPSTGVGNILAHAFAPPDIDGGSGNVHLDGNETWVTVGAAIGLTSATIDLETILLHELGHSLGLSHIHDNLSLNTGVVMQPGYFGPLTVLAVDDIAGVQSLYCAVGQVCGISGVPEPTTLWLSVLALTGLATSRVRRRV